MGTGSKILHKIILECISDRFQERKRKEEKAIKEIKENPEILSEIVETFKYEAKQYYSEGDLYIHTVERGIPKAIEKVGTYKPGLYEQYLENPKANKRYENAPCRWVGQITYNEIRAKYRRENNKKNKKNAKIILMERSLIEETHSQDIFNREIENIGINAEKIIEEQKNETYKEIMVAICYLHIPKNKDIIEYVKESIGVEIQSYTVTKARNKLKQEVREEITLYRKKNEEK